MGVNFDAREPARVVSCKRPSSPLRMTLRARACPAAGTSDSLIPDAHWTLECFYVALGISTVRTLYVGLSCRGFFSQGF